MVRQGRERKPLKEYRIKAFKLSTRPSTKGLITGDEFIRKIESSSKLNAEKKFKLTHPNTFVTEVLLLK